jgi:hypothetical protein
MTARTSIAVNVGQSLRMSSVESPSAKLTSTVRKVTRVPFMTGSPRNRSGEPASDLYHLARTLITHQG